MSTPQAKRRRLNEASKTLHKPFKSPFRTPLKPATSLSDSPANDPTLRSNITSTPTDTTACTPSSYNSISAAPRRLSFTTPSRPRPKKISPALTREIVQARSDIQILSQALSLATSNKDENLARLIDTWRTASRAAAEELFAKTRDRVNRMGGVGAWKEKEREQKEWRQKWDREELEAERQRRQEESGDNEHEDYGFNANKDNTSCARVEESRDESGPDTEDDSFTMDMMLKTLNIDLELIGYDKISQRWTG